MNELKISIKNPYTNKEILPIITDHEENEKFWNGTMACMEPFNLQVCRVKDPEGPNGYMWLTYPCLCYGSYRDSNMKVYSSTLKDVLDNYAKQRELLERILLKKDYSKCVNCTLYHTIEIAHNSQWPSARSIIDAYGFYGKLAYESQKNNALSDALLYPYEIKLAIDAKCNLECPTCRDRQLIMPDMAEDELNMLMDFVKKCHCMSIGNDGEVFMNDVYKRILATDLSQNSNLESIVLYTNGTLLNEENWNAIHPNNKKLLTDIKISLDAACEDTYKVVRSKTQWNNLLKNLKFLQKVKPQTCRMSSTYTISKYNYKDVVNFTEFAKSYGFTKIDYTFARPRLHGDNTDDFCITDTATRNELISIIKQDGDKFNDYYFQTFMITLV